MEQQAAIPPGLPRPNPTISYWQDPPDNIADLRTTEHLPETADFVIIGSGISGACIAYNILAKRPNAKVVMLEARRACSGATGRNGGHTKAASYLNFMPNASELGPAEALKIARFEYSNIKQMHAFARANGIECDLRSLDTVDIIYDAAQWETRKKSIQYMQKHMSEEEVESGVGRYIVHDANYAREKLLCPDAVGAIQYEAGSLSAYRLVCGILKLGLEKGLNMQMNTPAESVHKLSEGEHWEVKTPRGKITAPKIVLATNGYSAHLCPRLQKVIVPLRGQVSAQRPGKGLPTLPTTYSFIYENGYEYMISRPPGSKFAGDIVIGGGWAKLPDEGASEFGNTDDTVIEPRVSRYLTNSTAGYFGPNWGEDNPEGRVRREWSGIMGTSADGRPYVGEVPGESGLWISASFDGHGMALCYLSARGMVDMMLGEGGTKLNDWFPSSFIITKERLKTPFQGRRRMRAPPDDMFEVKSQL